MPPPMEHNNNNNKKNKNKKRTLPLPDDLILEILLKLRVKSLLRFASVSKSWRSLITSNPTFAQSHFRHHPHPPPLRLLHIDFHFNSSVAHSIDVNASLHNDSAHSTLSFPLQTFSHPVPIRASCRGILLLDDYTNLFLWNPTTAYMKRLSYPPLASSPSASSISLGFGYDESNDDYLVVATASTCHVWAPKPASWFEFFSTRTKSWSRIESSRFYYLRVGDQSGWFLNGSVHWLVQDGNWNHVIIAFDLMERRLLPEISLPREFNNYGNNSCKLRVMGGCLSVCFCTIDDEVEIWVMKDYRLSSSWTKQIVVTDYRIPLHHLSPICFNRAGEVIAKDDRVGLVKLDGRGELVELRAYCSTSTTALYMETLLSPPNFDEASEDDQ